MKCSLYASYNLGRKSYFIYFFVGDNLNIKTLILKIHTIIIDAAVAKDNPLFPDIILKTSRESLNNNKKLQQIISNRQKKLENIVKN